MILLCWRFPEDREENAMEYSNNESKTALLDAFNFREMYHGTLYVSVVETYSHGEKEIFRWTNPLAEILTKVVKAAGAAMSQPLTTSDFVEAVGPALEIVSSVSTAKALCARPPSEGQFASPLPTTSKVYGGRRPSMRRARR